MFQKLLIIWLRRLNPLWLIEWRGYSAFSIHFQFTSFFLNLCQETLHNIVWAVCPWHHFLLSHWWLSQIFQFIVCLPVCSIVDQQTFGYVFYFGLFSIGCLPNICCSSDGCWRLQPCKCFFFFLFDSYLLGCLSHESLLSGSWHHFFPSYFVMTVQRFTVMIYRF